MQVADAVGDTRAGEWANLAGDYLAQRLGDRGRCSSLFPDYAPEWLGQAGSHITDGLSELPDSVQHRIFSRVDDADAHMQPHERWNRLFYFLPERFHSNILATAISDERNLEIELCKQSLPVVTALASLPDAATPLIASLKIRHCFVHPEPYDWCQNPEHGVSVAVVRALRHHTGLSSLCFSHTYINTQCFTQLASAVSTLTSLQILKLSACRGFEVRQLPLLQQTLQDMSQLHTLSFSLDVAPKSRRCTESKDVPDEPYAPPELKAARLRQCSCLAAMLSAAAALTSLTLRVYSTPRASVNGWHTWFEAPHALTVPHLQVFTLAIGCSRWAASLLRQLDAPLVRLFLCDADGQDLHEHGHDAVGIRECVRLLSKFPLLRHMPNRNLFTKRWTGQVSMMLLRTELTALQWLHNVQDARFHMRVGTAHELVPLMPVALPGLRRLYLSVEGEGGLRRSTREQWYSVVEHIHRWQLQDFALSVDELRFASDVPEADVAAFVPADLFPMACLSSLDVGGCRFLDRPGALDALARMTQLRCLHLKHVTVPAEVQAALLPSLQALSRLTQLELTGGDTDVWQAFAGSCRGGGLQGVWPELRHLQVQFDLSVTSWEAGKPQAVVRTLSSLPTLQVLYIRGIQDICDDGDSPGVDDKSLAIQLKLLEPYMISGNRVKLSFFRFPCFVPEW